MDTIVFNNDGFKFTRIKKNNYNVEFTIENKNLIISKIIDFNLFKLIYDLNPDIYEKVEIEKINEKEVIATLLMKHLFEDLGLNQKFSFIYIQKFADREKIIFKGETITTHRPEGIPQDAELTPIKDLNCICYILSKHKMLFSFNIKSFCERLK